MAISDNSPPGWDNTQAFAEGWGIFAINNSASDETFQLQVLQDTDFWDGTDLFAEDSEAWLFVHNMAKEGSAYHCAALAWLRIHAPKEAGFIMDEACRRGSAP